MLQSFCSSLEFNNNQIFNFFEDFNSRNCKSLDISIDDLKIIVINTGKLFVIRANFLDSNEVVLKTTDYDSRNIFCLLEKSVKQMIFDYHNKYHLT